MIFVNAEPHGHLLAQHMHSVFSPNAMVVISRAEIRLLPNQVTPLEILTGGRSTRTSPVSR